MGRSLKFKSYWMGKLMSERKKEIKEKKRKGKEENAIGIGWPLEWIRIGWAVRLQL
jgi:hypothetical protein